MDAYFCSVGKDLASKIDAVPNPIVTGKYNLKPHNKYFHFKTIGVQDIREAMVKIKTSNSFGSDRRLMLYQISFFLLQLRFLFEN